MSDTVDTRVSLDLHPGNIEGMDSYDEDTRPVLAQAVGLLNSTHSALVAIHDAKAAAATNPTLNEAAQLLAVDDYAGKRMGPVTREWDKTVRNLDSNIAIAEQELAAPLEQKASQMVSGELRAHFKAMKPGERMAGVQAAIDAGDEVVVSAVLGAPAMLSGLTTDMQTALRQQWNEKANPVGAKRLRAMNAAKAYLDRCGGIVLKEWHDAVGVIEKRTKTRGGPDHVQVVTASDIRAQKAKADASFVLPTN